MEVTVDRRLCQRSSVVHPITANDSAYVTIRYLLIIITDRIQIMPDLFSLHLC